MLRGWEAGRLGGGGIPEAQGEQAGVCIYCSSPRLKKRESGGGLGS
jgi:hypothetical protein